MIDRKIWWSLVIAIVVALLFWLVIWQIKSISNTQPTTASSMQPRAVDMVEQEQKYLASLKDQVAKLKPIMLGKVDSAYIAVITSVKQQLIDLRVPVTWQDYHLSLVLKLSLLEELITGQSTNQADWTKKIESTEGQVVALLAKLDSEIN